MADLPPTRWSLVARAGNRDRTTWTADLDILVTAYSPVLLRHLVANMRLPPSRAEDLVQGFLSDKILEQNVLRLASQEKGRFRSFLLKVFGNYVIGQLRRDQAQKRRPAGPDAVDIAELPSLASADADPAGAFDTIWARQVLAQTLDRMQAECRAKQRQDLWSLFDARILGPLLGDATPLPYDRLVARFGLKSPAEAANLLITARRMFIRVLHGVVRETVAEDRDVAEELRDLKRILAGS